MRQKPEIVEGGRWLLKGAVKSIGRELKNKMYELIPIGFAVGYVLIMFVNEYFETKKFNRWVDEYWSDIKL